MFFAPDFLDAEAEERIASHLDNRGVLAAIAGNASVATPVAHKKLRRVVFIASSRENVLHHISKHIRQPVVAALQAEREPRVVEAEQVQNRRLQIVDVNRVAHHARSFVICSDASGSPCAAASRHLRRCSSRGAAIRSHPACRERWRPRPISRASLQPHDHRGAVFLFAGQARGT